jgi:hypothetical protein
MNECGIVSDEQIGAEVDRNIDSTTHRANTAAIFNVTSLIY